MNQLSLGIVVSLRDAFSFRAKGIEQAFRSLDSTAYRAARGIQRSIGNIDLGFGQVARTLAGGAAVLSALIFPTLEALKFNQALSEVSTIADQATFSVGKLRDVILDQAIRLPTRSLTDQTQAVYEAVSAGFLQSADAAYIAEEATKTAVTTMASTQTTLKGIVGLLNAYNMSAGRAGHVSDLLFQTVRFGVVRMEELAHNIGMVSAAAAASGESLENMLGTYAGLTLGGLSPEQSAQYSRQLYLSIIKPTKGAMQEAKKYGLTLNKDYFNREGGLFGTLINMAEKSHAVSIVRDKTGKILDSKINDPASFFRMLSGRQAAAGAAVLLMKAAQIQTILGSIANDVAVDEFGISMTNREFALRQRMKDLSFNLQLLRSQFGAFSAIIGTAVTGVLTPLTRAFTALFGPVVRFAKAYPMFGKLVTGTIFAWGAALMWWAAIQVQAIRHSFAFLRLMAGFSRAHVTLLGMRIPLNQLASTLAGTVSVFILGAALIHSAWENNVGGLADKVRNFVLVFRALTQNFQSQVGVWGEMDADLARQLLGSGMNQTFITWFQWLTRLKYGFKGVFEGMRSFTDSAVNGIFALGKGLGNIVSYFSGPLGRGITGFFDSIKSNGTTTNTIRAWREIGQRIGHLVGFFGSLVLLTKLWRSAVLAVRISAWLLTAPFKAVFNVIRALVLMVASLPQKLAALKGFFSGMWSQSGSWWANIRKQLFGGGASGSVVGPAGAVAAGRGVGRGDCCSAVLRLLGRAVNYLRLIYGELAGSFFGSGGRNPFGPRPRGGPGFTAYGTRVATAEAELEAAANRRLLTRGGAVGPYVGRAPTATARISTPAMLGAGAVGVAGISRMGGFARGIGRFFGKAALFIADFFTMGLASAALGGAMKMLAGATRIFRILRVAVWNAGGALGFLRVAFVGLGETLAAIVSAPILPWIIGIGVVIGGLIALWVKFRDRLMQVGWIHKLAQGIGWLKDKIVDLLKATGLVGEDKFQDLYDRSKQAFVAGAGYQTQAQQALKAGGGISPEVANSWIKVFESGLQDYLMEKQSGALVGNKKAEEAYKSFAFGLVSTQQWIRQHGMKGFNATVDDKAVADVVKEITGQGIKVATPDGFGAGGASGMADLIGNSDETNNLLGDIADNTKLSVAQFEALRRGGAAKDYDGPKFPDGSADDPYAAFAMRRMSLLARQRGEGGPGGDVGDRSMAGTTEALHGVMQRIHGAIQDLVNKDSTLIPVDVKVNEKTLATITLRTIDSKTQETRERGPNITRLPGVYPAMSY